MALAKAGWAVDVTGRDSSLMPAELTALGVQFHSVERADVASVGRVLGDGADLLVDLLAYRASDVRAVLPLMASVSSPVLVSSRAVYVDGLGRHVNSDEPPHFEVPIAEDAPTLAPANDDVNPFSREGYAPSKVAAERVALDSGLQVTVIRPSKVHGRWARNPRTRMFVEAMMAGTERIELAHGTSIDHLTAAGNTAALISTVALKPGARILNSADPDSPGAEQILRAIGSRLGWTGTLELLDDAVPDRGLHPWLQKHPIVLDTRASHRLGYKPVGAALNLLAEEVDWVASQVRG
nr:nucleoside-diphosphate sugar epimerase [Arthrobacter pigmenti]